MKIIKKLSNLGFSHVELLILIVGLVAILGTYAIVRDYADAKPKAIVTYGSDKGYNYQTLGQVSLQGVKFTLQACQQVTKNVIGINSNTKAPEYGPDVTTVLGRAVVGVQAGKKTVQYGGHLMSIYTTTNTVTVAHWHGWIVSRGYNPLVLYRNGPTASVVPEDNWL